MTVKKVRASKRDARWAAHQRALRLVPASGRLDDLVENVAAATGRPVHLLAFALGRGEPTGLWIATDTGNYVVYPEAASAAERTAIICHELAHILLDHEPQSEAARLDDLVATVAPNIDPAIARRMLARHGYGEGVEAEAEDLATRLVARLASRGERDRIAQDTISSRLR